MARDSVHEYMNVVEKRLANPIDPLHALMRNRTRAFLEHAVDGARAGMEDLRGIDAY